MEHIFHRDSEEHPPLKFVTARRPGTEIYETLVHAALESGSSSHDHLMADLLRMMDIADIPKEQVVPGLKALEDVCMGGGRFEDGVVWRSSTLQNALKRVEPLDERLANKLIDDVRQWFRETMLVGAK